MSSQKNIYGKKILKTLAGKAAIPMKVITTPEPLLPKEGKYALSRAAKNLVQSGYAEILNSDKQNYLRITKTGKVKLNSLLLEGSEALVPTTWDGFWRIIMLDLPEERKSERESLRYLLKKANFVCIKNTVWISPLPYENLFTNIKKDLDLSDELMIIVTDKLDEQTSMAFLEAMKN